MTEYIEREKVLGKGVPVDGFFSNMISAWDVANIPAADVAPVVHGRWVKVSEYMPIYNCSICGNRNLFGDNVFFNYCPNCGAKMDGDELNEI